MKEPVRILIVEDNADDADLAKHEINKVITSCEFQRVETREAFVSALETFQPDVILSDYSLPHFDGMKALRLSLKYAPLTPFIIWAGSINEDAAVKCMKAGANNYILKDNFKRLGPAVVHALEERELLIARTQAEERVRERERQLSILFSNLPGPVYRCQNDAEFTMEFISDGIERLTGYQVEDFRQHRRHFGKIIHPDDQARVWSEIQSAAEKDQSFELTYRILTATGQTKWVWEKGHGIRDAKGQLQALEGFITDITVKKEAEQALQNNERRFRALIENGLDDISLLAPDGSLLWESPSTVRNLGYPPAEFVGRDIFQIMHPEDVEWARKIFAKLAKEPGSRQCGTFRLRRADGTWRWVEAIATNMLQESSVKAIVVNYRDVTEQKQAAIELQKKNDDLALINTLNELINRGENLDAVVNRLREEFKQIFSSEYTNIYLPSADGQSLKLHQYSLPSEISRGIEKVIGRSIPKIEFPIQEDGIFQKVLRSAQGVVLNEQNEIQKWIGEFVETASLPAIAKATIRKLLPQIYKILNIKSTVLVPLISDGKILGVVNVSGSTILTEQDLQRIENICGQLTIALHRRQVEEVLNEERTLLRTLIDNLPDRIYAMDRQGRKTLSNTADWRASGGKNMEEVIGRTDFDLYPPGLADEYWQLDKAVLDSGQPVINHEEPGLDANANQVSVLTTKIPLRDEEGNVVGLVGIGRDISERKQAESERQALLEIMQGLANTKDLKELLKLVHDSIAKVIYAENFYVCLYQQSSALFEEIYSVDEYDPPQPPSKLENSITAYVFRSGKPLLLTKASFNELAAQGEVKLIGTDSASWLGVPLKTSGRTIGVMAVQDYENDNRYSEREKDFLISIATQVALVIEHKRAEEALRESEEHYRTVFEGVQDAIFVESLDGKILLVNERACEMFGYSQAEFLTKTVADLVPPGNSVLMSGATEENLCAEPRETMNRRANGEVFPIEISGRIQVIHGQKVLLVVVRDITERKRVEAAEHEQRVLAEALRDTAETLSRTLDYGEVLDHILTAVGRVVPHDAASILLIEGEAAQVVRSHGYDKHNYDPKIMGVKLPLASTTNLLQMLETRQPVVVFDTYSYPGWQRMTETDWLRSNVGAPITIYGEIIGFICLDSQKPEYFTPVHAQRLESFANQAAIAIHNSRLLQQAQDEIAERKRSAELLRESEERFSSAFEYASIGMALVTTEGRWSRVNRALCSLLGYSEAELLQKTFQDITHPDDLQIDLLYVHQLLTGEINSYQMEKRYFHKFGQVVWTLLSVSVVRDHNGKPQYFVSQIQDITERKQAETSLQAERERAQNYLDTAGVIMLALNRDGTVILVNQKGCEILGYTPSEIVGRNWINTCLPEASRDKPQDIFQRLISGQTEATEYFENMVLTKSGEQRLIAWHNTVIRDEDGNIVSTLSSGEDITERRKVETALVESNTRFRTLFEASPDAIVLIDPTGDWPIIDCNTAACQMNGYTREELIGQSVDILNTDPERPNERAEYMQRIQKHGILHYETSHRHKDGTNFAVEVSTSLIQVGTRQLVLGIDRDITERKRAENELHFEKERFESIAATVPGIICSFRMRPDGSACMPFATQAIQDVYGLLPTDVQHDVTPLFSRIHLDDLPRMLTAINESAQTKLPWHSEFRYQHPAKGEVWIEGQAVPLEEEDGSIIWHGFINDITERKKNETALVESNTRFRTLFEASPDAIVLIDPNGDWPIIDCNTAACQMNGYTREELIGQSVDVLNLRASEVDKRGEYLESIRQAGVLHFEEFHQRKDGSAIAVDVCTSLIKFGTRDLILGIDRDITERKRAEKEIQRRAEETSALLETSLALTSLDLEATLQTIGNSANTLFLADGCRIFLMEPDGETLRCVLALQENTVAFSDLRIKVGEGVTGAVAASGVAEIVNEMQDDPRAILVPDTQEEQEAIIFAPLKERDHTIGILSVRRVGNKRHFQPTDLGLLEAFASMAASAVSNARLFEETQRRLDDLHASEERFRQLADNIQEAFWMTDAESGREIYMSPAIETIWGRSIQHMMHEPDAYLSSIFPEDQPAVLDAIAKEKRGEKMQFEYRIVRPDGSLRWIWDRAFPIFDETGTVRRIAGISADITERKEAAEKLRESEDRYHSLFQNQLHGSALHEIVTNDQGQPVDYIFLKVNPAFEKMTGLPAQDLVGRCVTEVLPGIENERLIQIYGQVALTGEPAYLNEYVAPLGRYYEINAYATGHRQFAVSFMDVTERREAEQELRKLSRAVEQSSSTIIITNTSGNIEYVNPKFTQITGYSFEEVIGRNPRILKSGFTSEEEYAGLWQTIISGGEWHGELLNKKKDGQLFWESVTISPILNDRREITHFVGVKEDITERKQSEIETRRHIAELEAVYENGLSVGRLLQPSEIGNRVIETFSRYLPWHHVTIRLRKDDSDDLELVAFSLPNLKEEERTDAEQYFVARINKVGQGLSGWAIQTGNPFRTGNVHAHPQYIDTHAGIQSGLYMPLKVGERVIGVISVESEVPDAFTEQDERLLATLANQTAVAFENARLYEAMQKELSERKRVEDALRVSETHYRALADSITDILFELDQDLHYTHWNKASETLTGISAAEAIGKSMEDVLGRNEEQARIQTIYEDVLKNHKPRTFGTTLAFTGEKRFFEITAYPSMRGVSVVAKDVTDRKRTEAIMQKRFELMEYAAKHSLKDLMQKTVDEVSDLTGSTIGFFHFMEEDQIHLGMQTWSTNALQLFHVSSGDGAHMPINQAGVWAEAVRQRRPLIQNDYEALEKKKGVPQGHVPIVREMVIPIIRNECIMAVMGIGNKSQEYTTHDLEIASRLADYAWDITERKQMEIALEIERNQLVQRVDERTADLSRANSNLARALRVKDEFLANMSHELRTPLNAILGLSESLSEQIAGPLNEKQQKYISTISESGHHLLSLINDILDLAKIDAGHITLDINKVDIRSVCNASLRMIKQLAQKKSQEVSLEIDDGLGLMWADERRLKQMIVNLLGNAVKFTPEDGRLGLEVHGDKEANQVAITVWDNGIGIKEDDLSRLFQPFVQLDSGLAREATGTGLGLALVAQMARLHGGGVNAVSEAGRGSRFTIVLPWEPALAMDSASRMKITGKFLAIQTDDTNKPSILLVEDTKEVVMMLKDYLELAGYKVFTAQDGIDGIVQARHVKPDLILMDIQMPRMDGFETTRKLRSDPNFRYTPIIALTALAMPHDRERCLEAGMDEYISKPVNLKALVKIIQSCLFKQESHPR